MSKLFHSNAVQYACGCGNLQPMTKLFFCRHCLRLRCGFCVSHEVDSHFCCNCLENIPSSEAKLKLNRCNNCFDCPSCQHTLSSRGTTVQVAASKKTESTDGTVVKVADEKMIPRKMYYLSCLACRWTSRDVGIPDQTVAVGQWPEAEYEHGNRFGMLMEHYQNVALQEKQEKQDFLRRKTMKQHKYPSLTDRTGLTASMVRRQMGWTDKTTPIKKARSTINPSIPLDDVDDLPDNIFTERVILKNITTIKQRLANPSRQPVTVDKLYPQTKSLSIKKSLRCKQCEHNVIKPEYNPTSIKYRIQLVASHHVPDIQLIDFKSIKFGHSSPITLKFINPTMQDMTITIMDLPTVDEETLLIEEMKKTTIERPYASIASMPSLTATFSRQASLNEEPRFVNRMVNATITLPDSSFTIGRRDTAADFDEPVPIKHTAGDGPKFILWQRANKVAIKLTVNPLDCKEGEHISVGFSMQYTYLNTVTTAATVDKREPQMHALMARIYIDLGMIGSDDGDN